MQTLRHYLYREIREFQRSVAEGIEVSERIDLANERSGEYVVRRAKVVSAERDDRGDLIVVLDNGSKYVGFSAGMRAWHEDVATDGVDAPIAGASLYPVDHNHDEQRQREDFSSQLNRLAGSARTTMSTETMERLAELLGDDLPEPGGRGETWVG